MQPGKRQLKRHQHQYHACRRKKSMKRNAQRALKEEKPHGHRRRDPHHRSDPRLQALARKLHGAQDQRQLRPLAQHHQEYKQENPPARRAPGALGISLHFLLDFFFQVARNAIHPYDHRNNEGRRDQEHQPLKAVFTDTEALQGHRHSQAEHGSHRHAVPDESSQVPAARAGKIDEDNADDQRSFNAFTKCDKKSREHKDSSCKSFATTISVYRTRELPSTGPDWSYLPFRVRLSCLMLMRTIRLSTSLLLSLLLCTQVPAQAPSPSQLKDTMVSPDPNRAHKAAERGDKAQAAGRFDDALAAYDEAARYAPQDVSIVERGVALRSRLVRAQVEAAERDALAGRLTRATEELGAALQVDPGNTIVEERLAQLKAMDDEPRAEPATAISGLPRLQPQAGRRSLDLRGDTKTVYEQLAALFGVKVTFDPDTTLRIARLHVDNVDFFTAMALLGSQSGTFWRPLNPLLMFVAPDTPEKRRLYAVVAEQTFPLSAAVGPEDVTEMLRVLRDITGATRIDLDTRSRTITMRDTPERLALAGELIQQLERARGEVMLEIELLEVDRNKARDLGITPPATSQLIALSTNDLNKLKSSTNLTNLLTNIQQVFAGKGFSSIPAVIPIGGGLSTFLLTLPSGAVNFSDSLSLVQSGRQVLLRAQDGKPASFFVGDRFPITLSLLSGSVGNSSGLTGLPGSTIFPETSFAVGANPSALVANSFTG